MFKDVLKKEMKFYKDVMVHGNVGQKAIGLVTIPALVGSIPIRYGIATVCAVVGTAKELEFGDNFIGNMDSMCSSACYLFEDASRTINDK